MAEDVKLNEFPTGFPTQIIGLSQEGDGVSIDSIEFVRTMGCLDRNQASGMNENIRYVQIAQMKDIQQEGVNNNIMLLISGGSNYTSASNLVMVGVVVHRSTVSTNKNALLGGLRTGYVFRGNQLELWIASEGYNHPVNVIVVASTPNTSLVYNTAQAECPEGFIEF